ncbi:sigma factor-like helix-turn-helix DNA-binding protein [Actinomadura keratinilytica]
MALRTGKSAGQTAPAPMHEPAARAFRSLSWAHREILTETYFRRRSVNEAAASLGLPVEVVKARVYHALRALRDACEAPG